MTAEYHHMFPVWARPDAMWSYSTPLLSATTEQWLGWPRPSLRARVPSIWGDANRIYELHGAQSIWGNILDSIKHMITCFQRNHTRVSAGISRGTNKSVNWSWEAGRMTPALWRWANMVMAATSGSKNTFLVIVNECGSQQVRTNMLEFGIDGRIWCQFRYDTMVLRICSVSCSWQCISWEWWMGFDWNAVWNHQCLLCLLRASLWDHHLQHTGEIVRHLLCMSDEYERWF